MFIFHLFKKKFYTILTCKNYPGVHLYLFQFFFEQLKLFGWTNYHVAKYGDVAGISVISQEDDIILISAEGVIIRIKASDIRICARPSKGVTLMKIKDDNKIVSFARLPHEDGETEDFEVTDENSEEGAEDTEEQEE